MVTTTVQKDLIIFALGALALMASGYILIFFNPKFSLFGVATIFLALFLILGLVARATPGVEDQVLERVVLGVTTIS
jgi:hypothetical protein